MYSSSSSLRRPTIKQKSDFSMSKHAPEKRRWLVYLFIYVFVGICITTGLADVFLLLKSVLRQFYSLDGNDEVTPPYVKELAIASDVSARMKEFGITEEKSREHGRCAINFFGLPRAFESLVLPSIINNVVKPNPGCDYYVHYYHMTEELEGRSGMGGTIDPTAIVLLRDAVFKIATERNEPLPIVEFIFDREEDFWNKYNDLTTRIRTTTINGKYLYFPWKAKTYRHPVTTDNIVKMWHSIQSSYLLMEQTAAEKNIDYEIVAMLRSDVVYITPIDIHDGPKPDHANATAPVTVPDFGKHPVSDRIIYGPREAVKIWATERFSHLDSHVKFILENDPGWGMHSERFINYTIFPLIREITQIRPHPTICFFRARADQSVWVSDCYGASSNVAAASILENLRGRNLRDVVQDAVGHKCPGAVVKLTRTVKSLDCTKPASVASGKSNVE
jgi:hypothetical protein